MPLSPHSDTWQEISVVGLNSSACPASVAKDGTITLCLPAFAEEQVFWERYGEELTARVAALPPRHGAFVTNCPVHCQTGVGWEDPSVGAIATLGQAVSAWWPDALAHSREPGWAAPRFVARNTDGCLLGAGGGAHHAM